MHTRFLGQPFDGDQIGVELSRALSREGMKSLVVVVAWAKDSGLSRVMNTLRDFRKSGGSAELIVGIDEGGASTEGLKRALELFDVVRVFHDPGPRTFHPKVYVARGDSDALAIVGSGNATLGGLFKNYEAAIAIDLNLKDSSSDTVLLHDIETWLEALRSQQENCLLLDDDLLEVLTSDPRYLISSERDRRSRSIKSTDVSGSMESVFGGAIPGLGSAPPRDESAVSDDDDVDSEVWRPVAVPSENLAAKSAAKKPSSSPTAAGSRSFWKALSKWDVNPGSSPGQMVIPKEFWSFFPKLSVQHDHTATGGSRQSEAVFAAKYIDGIKTKDLAETRIILYEPAANHPRPNPELRYTLLDKEIMSQLSEKDILEFSRDAQGLVVVRRRPPGSRSPGRWGWF